MGLWIEIIFSIVMINGFLLNFLNLLFSWNQYKVKQPTSVLRDAHGMG